MERNELENLLIKKFKYDSDAVIEHLLDNKGIFSCENLSIQAFLSRLKY
jgi:hypothetical protein